MPVDGADAGGFDAMAGSDANDHGGAGGSAGGVGGDGASGDGDGDGAGGAGRGSPPLGSCMASALLSCPPEDDGSACAEWFCGTRLWAYDTPGVEAHLTYRIRDPNHLFSAEYEAAIHAIAQAWTDATLGRVKFDDCSKAKCTGRFISVIPGDWHGLLNPGDGEQFLPMPVSPNGEGAPSRHRISHQWGHAIGLDDTYKRGDRDRYVRFDRTVWCGAGGGVPPRCAVDPANQLGSPPIASGTFGVYDERSKMNGFATQGICGGDEPDAASGQPTASDASAVLELYLQRAGWAPWQPIGRSHSPDQPLDYQLAPGVDPVGGPVVSGGRDPSVEVFVRGSDGAVYATRNVLAGDTFVRWDDWTPLGEKVDADPSVTFLDQDTLHLAARSATDQTIVLRTRTRGNWDAWTSLGAPAMGADSAPAIAALDGKQLTVVVRGRDGLLYQQTCRDPRQGCIANAGNPDVWTPLDPPLAGWSFVGKPNVVWSRDADRAWMVVAAAGTDHRAHWLWHSEGSQWGNGTSGWQELTTLDLAPDDPEPAVGIDTRGSYADVGFFARTRQGLLANISKEDGTYLLGGILASPPGSAGAGSRVLVVGLMNDHGRPGVWWKFANGFTPPCTYNAPGACATCGCSLPGTFRCLE